MRQKQSLRCGIETVPLSTFKALKEACFRFLLSAAFQFSSFRPFRSLSLVCSKRSTENAALSSCPCSAGHPVMQARRGISREQSCGQKRPIMVEERQRWPCILFQTGSPACGRGRRNVVPRLSAAARLACDGSDQGVWAPLERIPIVSPMLSIASGPQPAVCSCSAGSSCATLIFSFCPAAAASSPVQPGGERGVVGGV